MPRARHPKKDVEAALRMAEQAGWTVRATVSGHRWGVASCGSGCVLSIWSTPRNAGTFAKVIRRRIERCPHVEGSER